MVKVKDRAQGLGEISSRSFGRGDLVLGALRRLEKARTGIPGRPHSPCSSVDGTRDLIPGTLGPLPPRNLVATTRKTLRGCSHRLRGNGQEKDQKKWNKLHDEEE